MQKLTRFLDFGVETGADVLQQRGQLVATMASNCGSLTLVVQNDEQAQAEANLKTFHSEHFG